MLNSASDAVITSFALSLIDVLIVALVRHQTSVRSKYWIDQNLCLLLNQTL
jgi:hypothetical protein